MFQTNTLFSLFLAAVFCFFSCKKDKDEFGPDVTFETPTENQFFKVNDVIHIKASVKDETKISTLSISLVDQNLNPAHISMSAPISSPTMNVNMFYTLDNIHLESGTYFILITASDGKNDSYPYRKIFIQAVPKVLNKIFVASSTGISQTNFFYIDSAYNTITPYKNFYGDYIGSSVSSYFQQVYMCGNYTGNFTGIKLSDNGPRFNVSPLVSSSPYFTGFYNTDMVNYTARFDGNIIGYDYTGNTVYGAQAEPGFYAKHFCLNSNHIIAEQKEITSAARKLVTYYPTGGALQSATLNQDVAAFCEKDDHQVFVFGNNAGQCVIQLFDRLNNNLWNPYPYTLAAGTILSAVKIDPDTYLIGHSNGTIYRYQYQSPSVTIYLTGYTAIQLKYDFEANRLYVAEANRISSIDYPSGTFIKSINSAETVLDIHLLYNR